LLLLARRQAALRPQGEAKTACLRPRLFEPQKNTMLGERRACQMQFSGCVNRDAAFAGAL
jgi:hypothetical protein